FRVEIPKIKGKIITKKKGNARYILYQYGSKYNPEKKYAVPDRAIIGKVTDDDSSMMFPNEKFETYFSDVPLPEKLPEAYRSCCLRIGSYVIIKKVMQEYNLPMMLEKLLKKDCGLFLDLVSYMIVNEENAGQYYPDFAFCHPLFSEGMRIYSDSKVSRFLSSVTKEQIIGFLRAWNKARDHSQRVYLSYDSTNKNCDAGDIDIAEFGKAKDDKGIPIFNLAIAFDEANRTPLLYEEYPGSINDVSQLTFLVDKVKEYGYTRIGFILDRGYFSKENIRYIDENGYEFIIMVKGCKALVSTMVEQNRGSFETARDCSIRSYKVYGKTVSCHLFEDDTEDRYLHIYFDPYKQAAEREHLEQRIDKMKLMIEKNVGKNVQFGKSYTDLFKLTYDKEGRLLYGKERSDVITRELRLCGYFCIVTSEKMTASAALIQYKGRDISEKLFKADKSFLGSRSMRVQSEEALSAKIFVEFVALIVRNRIYNLLKETMLKMESNPNYMTVPASLRELEKIEMVRRNNGDYKLDHAVTKKQKIILGSFGLEESDIRKTAEEINTLLINNQSLMSELTEEENDDGEE
ncbi:Transposase, partial [Oribacterium sp. KHPX15]|uniref:IS1634 family transposase n=1 Tax=Oribacterium sp. KHPX15 TaxID=1855342 RepID=UPI000896BDCC